MFSLEKMLALTAKDMKAWFRQPFMIAIGIIPLLLVLTIVGLFIASAEVLPAGVILTDSDPLAVELRDFMMKAKSGTGSNWFAIEDITAEEVLDQFEDGKILGYVVIPENITGRLAVGEIVELTLVVNNVNDDITKNMMQRVEDACNHVNRHLEIGSVTYYSPTIDFVPLTAIDVKFNHYIAASVGAMGVILTGSINTVTATSTEIEKKTVLELVAGASAQEIIAGKILAALMQTLICYVVISLVAFVLYGFLPAGDLLINLPLLVFLIIWGVLSFAGIGFLLSARIKQTIPAAIAALLLNIGGWYICGGLVPPEVWPGIIHDLAILWPGTYFFRSFISLSLIGSVELDLLFFDLAVTGLFGLVTFIIAAKLFMKEVRQI
ncbi:MAG: ABC transporter permease [Candidatus Odinarchaeota archaeon]